MDDARLKDLLDRAEKDVEVLRRDLSERAYDRMHRRAMSLGYAGRNLRAELAPESVRETGRRPGTGQSQAPVARRR
jgi:hypothetical protein